MEKNGAMKSTTKTAGRRASGSEPSDFGTFDGDPISWWLPDGRVMKLAATFTFTDANGRAWSALSGSKVDGASIPKLFWTWIGGPFEGKYRNASVVHDTECQVPHKHRWQDVHRMFYAGCRAGGVGATLAKIMFAAVYHFGPRWDLKDRKSVKRTLLSSDDFFRATTVIVRTPGIEPQEIERFTRNALVDQVSDLEVLLMREVFADVDPRASRVMEKKLQDGVFVPGRPSSRRFLPKSLG